MACELPAEEERRFFERMRKTWEDTAPNREKAAVDFKAAIMLLLEDENNSNGIFTSVHQGDRKSSDPGYYSEHLYLTGSRKDCWLIGRDLIGFEILERPEDPADWTPPRPADATSEFFFAYRFTEQDGKGRKVPVERQEKEFYSLESGGLVMYSKQPALPNPEDYGDDPMGQKAFQKNMEWAQEYGELPPVEASHFDIQAITDDIQNSTAQVGKGPIPSAYLPPAYYYGPRRFSD
jgi:hypothetical protein